VLHYYFFFKRLHCSNVDGNVLRYVLNILSHRPSYVEGKNIGGWGGSAIVSAAEVQKHLTRQLVTNKSFRMLVRLYDDIKVEIDNFASLFSSHLDFGPRSIEGRDRLVTDNAVILSLR
jgi:hypothetical protein